MSTRIEKDSMGELEVPENALYGAQTQRAINNFKISHEQMPTGFIKSLLMIKAAAAQTNQQLGLLDDDQAKAIIDAAETLLNDENLGAHFPVDIFQTGSGTSSNMNANEVLANLASSHSTVAINANDHVNLGQSSNDVIPSTIHVSAALAYKQQLLPALQHFIQVSRDRATELHEVVKTGRTHLMDAMPVRLSQTLNTFADLIELQVERLESSFQGLTTLAQGGTAVGTGVNAHPEFAAIFNKNLSQRTGVTFTPAKNFFTHIGSQDVAISFSGELKSLASSVIKIANDLRWMNSGPLTGLGEISLQALQPGSSIMPGKVNPVICEAALMVCAQVIGNDAAITHGAHLSNFELNVALPMVAKNILSSVELISNAITLLADKGIATFKVNEETLAASLARNPILVTALNPLIGYAKAAEIAKEAYATNRPVIDVANEKTDLGLEKLQEVLDPRGLC